ncbi:hypothetical protein ABH968_004837 [Lysinibacillus sp. RC79]
MKVVTNYLHFLRKNLGDIGSSRLTIGNENILAKLMKE